MTQNKDVGVQKSFVEQLMQNVRFYRSPVSFFLLLAFTTGNFIVSTSISSMTSIVATKVKQGRGFFLKKYLTPLVWELTKSTKMDILINLTSWKGFKMCIYCDSFCPEDVGSDRMCRITESTVNQQITAGLDTAMIRKHLEG